MFRAIQSFENFKGHVFQGNMYLLDPGRERNVHMTFRRLVNVLYPWGKNSILRAIFRANLKAVTGLSALAHLSNSEEAEKTVFKNVSFFILIEHVSKF